MPVEQLEQDVKVKPGQYYNQNDIDKDVKHIKDYLGAMGHETRAQAVSLFDKSTPGVCTVQYEVVERPPARVGQVLIAGNLRTKQPVILARCHFIPVRSSVSPTWAWPSTTWSGWASSSPAACK